MKFQDFKDFKHYFFGFQGQKSEISLTNNIVIIFKILINKLIKQNCTNKVQQMQRMQ